MVEWIIETHTHVLSLSLSNTDEAASVKAKVLLENISRRPYGQRKSVHETLKVVMKGDAIMRLC